MSIKLQAISLQPQYPEYTQSPKLKAGLGLARLEWDTTGNLFLSYKCLYLLTDHRGAFLTKQLERRLQSGDDREAETLASPQSHFNFSLFLSGLAEVLVG